MFNLLKVFKKPVLGVNLGVEEKIEEIQIKSEDNSDLYAVMDILNVPENSLDAKIVPEFLRYIYETYPDVELIESNFRQIISLYLSFYMYNQNKCPICNTKDVKGIKHLCSIPSFKNEEEFKATIVNYELSGMYYYKVGLLLISIVDEIFPKYKMDFEFYDDMCNYFVDNAKFKSKIVFTHSDMRNFVKMYFRMKKGVGK